MRVSVGRAERFDRLAAGSIAGGWINEMLLGASSFMKPTKAKRKTANTSKSIEEEKS